MKAYWLAALSALLYVAGYPAGLGWWPLSCVALAPLLWTLERYALVPKRALAVGALFSVITQLVGYGFLPETLLRFSKLPLLACWLVHFGLCLAQSGGIALWLCALAALRKHGRSPIVFAAPLWVLQELIWPDVFEAPLGAALHDVPALVQSAELGGVALVSLFVAAANAAVAALALGAVRRDRRALARAGYALAAVTAVALTGALRLASLQPELARAPALRVALVQADLGAEQKRADPRGYAERYVELARSVQAPFDLMVWPETALARAVPTRVRDMNDAHPSLAAVRAPLLTGAVTQDDSHIYNSALLFGADRQRIGRVDKRELLPFAETLPLGERFPKLYEWIRGAGHFTAGRATPVVALGPIQIALFICYEDMLPESVRSAVSAGHADLMVSISNDAWFGHSRAAYTHFAVARLRAVELHRTLVRATNSGVTAVVEPTGEIRSDATLNEHTAQTLVARAPLWTEVTFYTRAGRAVVLALIAPWLALSLWSPTVRRRSRSAGAA